MTPTADTFLIALIYVKPLELFAIIPMLDEEYESNSIIVAQGDRNDYTLGRIGNHNVAIVGPARGDQGTVATAQFASTVRLTSPKLIMGLLIGIGGGIPNHPSHDVRLGDIVIGAPETGPAVIQYDLGKRTSEGFELSRTLAKPPPTLLNVVNKVQSRLMFTEEDILQAHLQRFAKFRKARYHKPSTPDRLFLASYEHEADSVCAEHDKEFEILRQPRPEQGPYVHYSTILSGNTLMKSAAERDALSKSHRDALCFEMEAAGLVDVLPSLVIRGISDYSDSHKNDTWQRYAAASAAAYARELLLNMSKRALNVEGIGASPQDTVDEMVPGSRFSGGYTAKDNYGVQVGYNKGTITNNIGGGRRDL